MLAVPEVTVRSVAPILAVFALAVFRVKRTVNSSEEAGGSQHYLRMCLSCPQKHVRPLFVCGFSRTARAFESDETITTSLRRHVGLHEMSREFTSRAGHVTDAEVTHGHARGHAWSHVCNIPSCLAIGNYYTSTKNNPLHELGMY